MITCRQMTMSDLALVFTWRNDLRVYKHFFKSSPVDIDEHQKWFKRIINTPTVLFLMAEHNGAPCGTVRFDSIQNDCVEIGIYLAPEFHGRGLSSELLKSGETYLKSTWPHVKKIIARVREENAPSLKMFANGNYIGNNSVLEKKF